jgi:hypothetical protein
MRVGAPRGEHGSHAHHEHENPGGKFGRGESPRDGDLAASTPADRAPRRRAAVRHASRGGRHPVLKRISRKVRGAWVVVVPALAALFIPATATDTLVLPATLRQITEIAGIAFAGTVDSMRTMPLSNQIVTVVSFSRLRFAKGSQDGDVLRLRMFGGIYEGSKVGVDGQPQFEIGRRSIVLAHHDLGSSAGNFCPVVGMFQGFYPLVRDSVHNLDAVHDWANRPLLAISGDHIVVLDERRGPPPPGRADPVPPRPTTEVRFLGSGHPRSA